MQTIKKTFMDFFTARMMFFAIAPLIVCGILWLAVVGGIVYLVASYAGDAINNMLESSDALGSMIAHTWVIALIQWVIAGAIGFGGIFSSIYASVALAVFIISFLTPAIVRFVNSRHYQHHNTTSVSFGATFWIMFCDVFKFLGFLICSFIVFVVPVIGSIASSVGVFLSFFYLYYRFIITDVRSCVLDKERFGATMVDDLGYKAVVFVFYLLSHIPFVGFFCQIAFIIYLTHLVYEKELGYGLSK